jgi:hypothetical protein
MGGLFLLLGLGLVGFGVPRLLHQERKEDERSAMELDKLRAELRPQSARERQERLKDDDERDDDVSPGEKEATSEQGSPPKPQTQSRYLERARRRVPPDLRRRARDEAAVLARLADLAPSSYDYEMQAQVKLEGPKPLYLDALFISNAEPLPDIVVEIKFAGSSLAKNLNNRIVEAQSLLFEYMRRYRRQTIGWLIILLEEELPERSQHAVDETIAASADLMHISLVAPTELDQLQLPIDLG